MRGAASNALATVLLQRAGGRRRSRRRRRREEEGVALDGGGRPDYFSEDEYECDEREADALLHKLGYRLRLSALAFGYPPCPSCCTPPPRPAREEEGAIAPRGGSSMPSPSPSRGAVGRRFLRTTVIDDALPTSAFRALRRAFRPASRYWSEFYHHRQGNIESTNDQDDDDDDGDEGATRRRKRRRTTTDSNNPSSFASHNIPLPADDDAALLPDQLLRRSKSLLEQVALLIRRRLARRFPDIVDATSVEVWCHRRPRDGEHRLHYDMDEILLWERRRRREEGKRKRSGERRGEGEREEGGRGDATIPIGGAGGGAVGISKERPDESTAARRDDGEAGVSPSPSGASWPAEEEEDDDDDDDGISCPIVSCVLTVRVPGGACRSCGGSGANCAPTIVCDQSILRLRRGEGGEGVGDGGGTARTKNNVGYLCFPRPNRLLAFEGSLLHGVVPGVPPARERRPGGSSSDVGCDCDEDGDSRIGGRSHDDDDDDDDDGGSDVEGDDDTDDHRITLMMGFWGDVRTTISTTTVAMGDGTSSSSGTAGGPPLTGPNVPYASLAGTWTEELDPISMVGDDLAGNNKTRSAEMDQFCSDLVVVDPLWIPILDGTITEDGEKSFSEYSCRRDNDDIQPSSRFFLKSLDPRDIDNEVLSGT
jgi:hypothetical protein